MYLLLAILLAVIAGSVHPVSAILIARIVSKAF
jgi:hypothetical protein